MNAKAQSILEYNKIIALAQQFAVSEIGKEYLLEEEPCSTIDFAEKRLNETSEAESILSSTGFYPISYFPDVRDTVKKLGATYCLEARELLSLANVLKVSGTVKHLIASNHVLETYSLQLADHQYIVNEINRCIVSEEEIADKASTALSKIRSDIKNTEDRIKDKIANYIKGSSQKYLQEPIYTVRNGRYVIPVKAEFKSYIPGLIHDQSASGQTFYVEPTPIVELGNAYRTLLLDEQKEIQRILSTLTAMFAAVSEELYTSVCCLGFLDTLFAKAALAKKMLAVKPKLNSKSCIRLYNARHPLLDMRSVVPISVWIGDSYNTLIITGPNTGGKTVSLKTVGLLCLMAQTGYFIPADFGSELPVFSNIFADIGDEQSIEQSLSTFSAHMRNIVSILANASEGSLVLLDELGAGTDPSEGAALAQSILEYLNNSGAITFATTHYSEIKSFALSTPGMENASMEFDVEKMMPTYRMHIGIPGRSNAFEISSRLGLSASVINRAKEFLTSGKISLEEILAKAENNRLETQRALFEANQVLSEAKKKEEEVRTVQEKLDQYSLAQKAKAREEAREILRAAKEQATDIIDELRNTKGLDASSVERKANVARSKLREYSGALAIDESSADGVHALPQEIKPGAHLYSNKLHQNVEVLQAPDMKNEVFVQIGSLKAKLPAEDLAPIFTEIKKARSTGSNSKLNTEAMKMELDLRGYTVDDACMEIDRYIDMCHMHNRKEFNIIHGKGTGALREGVHLFLKKSKSVASFRMGAYGEGDAGVTVVTLKGD